MSPDIKTSLCICFDRAALSAELISDWEDFLCVHFSSLEEEKQRDITGPNN